MAQAKGQGFTLILRADGVNQKKSIAARGAADTGSLVVPSSLFLGGLAEGEDPVLWWGQGMRTLIGDYQGCLQKFLALKTSEDVLEFAGRYGVLGLWPLRADVPAGAIVNGRETKPDEYMNFDEKRDDMVSSDLVSTDFCRFYGDRVEFWLHLSSKMRAMVEVFLILSQGEEPNTEAVSTLLELFSDGANTYSGHALSQKERKMLSRIIREMVSTWSSIVSFSLVLEADGNGTRMGFKLKRPRHVWWGTLIGDKDKGLPGSDLQYKGDGNKTVGLLFTAGQDVSFPPYPGAPPPAVPSPLFAALMTELITVMVYKNGHICDRCGRWFDEEYRARNGQRTLCPTCQKAAKYEREQKSRAKRKQREQAGTLAEG